MEQKESLEEERKLTEELSLVAYAHSGEILGRLSQLFLTSDDQEMQDLGRQLGSFETNIISILFSLRPKETLIQDLSSIYTNAIFAHYKGFFSTITTCIVNLIRIFPETEETRAKVEEILEKWLEEPSTKIKWVSSERG